MEELSNWEAKATANPVGSLVRFRYRAGLLQTKAVC